ncbi:MAG: CHASE2 domain-containing protein [Cytophagaceae bacterium]|jgi:CHASE2 domain-containing sensor protein|nr:CHASE2 domain-containing protein [Cytophagaceae bacterium]
MKKLKILDAVGIIAFGTLLIVGISNIPISLDILNPISKMFSDFQQTDVVFSHMRENKEYDPNIVLVNIGNLDRAGIAAQIEIINKHKPKVIGIDAFFRNPKHSEDAYKDSLLVMGDSALARAISKVDNMVLGIELIEDTVNNKVSSIKWCHPMFRFPHTKYAYLDMISEGKNNFKTARNCFLREKLGDSVVLSFPAKMASLLKPECLKEIEVRNNDTETINYIGNVNTVTSDGTPNSKITFSAVDAYQVLNEEFEPEMFKDKIVIMGFMGDNFDKYDKEDRFFTPLNKNYVGRSDEDMYGVVVHANICSMVLNGNYINELPEWQDIILNLVIVFLNILLFMYLYFKLELFWDGATLLITVFQGVVLTFIVLYVFNYYNLILNFNYSLLALFLMPNIIELYYGVVKTSELKLRNKFSTLKVKKSGINLNK